MYVCVHTSGATQTYTIHLEEEEEEEDEEEQMQRNTYVMQQHPIAPQHMTPPPSPLPTYRQLLALMTEEELDQFAAYRRSTINRATVRRVCACCHHCSHPRFP